VSCDIITPAVPPTGDGHTGPSCKFSAWMPRRLLPRILPTYESPAANHDQLRGGLHGSLGSRQTLCLWTP
jgi:hypothetical protein